MAVNAFLIIVAIIMTFAVLGASIVFVNYFQSVDDRGEAWFPRAICVAGMWLALASMLIMPYDVANTAVDGGGGLSVNVLWEVTYISIAIMLGFMIPFAFFYYDSDMDMDDSAERGKCDSQTCAGLKYAFGFSICFACLLFTLYLVMATAEIPVERVAQGTAWVVGFNDVFPNYMESGAVITTMCPVQVDDLGEGACVQTSFIWEMPVTFPIFVIAFLSFFGWWFFMIFAGVGIVALPLDLINKFRTRSKAMTRGDFLQKKMDLGGRASSLREIGEKLVDLNEQDFEKKKDAAKQRDRVRQFEKAYHLLRMDVDILNEIKNMDANPLIPIFALIFGVLGGFMALMWLIHIIVFVLPDPTINDFLNTLFIDLSFPGFPFFGIIAYALFVYYLLWAVIVGNFRVGLRCMIIDMFPMEKNNTPINALLANIWVILLCSVPAVQFSATCFPVYARETYVDMIFGTQIEYMKYVSIFWQYNIFVISMICLSFLTMVYLCLNPSVDSERLRIEAQIVDMHTEREGKARE